MRFIRCFVAPVVALLTLAGTQSNFGLAQLASGSKTSAAPTSTNPQIRQCQITFDPAITAGPGASAVPTFSVTDFKLSVQYNPAQLSLIDIFFIPPFNENSPLIGGATPGAAPAQAANFINNTSTGIINNISGFAPPDPKTAGQDVNIFYADFQLNEGVPTNVPLSITIFADPNDPTGPDFTQGTDPSTGNTVTTPPTGVVEPTTIAFTFDEMTNIANGTPLPASASAGALTLGLLAGWRLLRRRLVAV